MPSNRVVRVLPLTATLAALVACDPGPAPTAASGPSDGHAAHAAAAANRTGPVRAHGDLIKAVRQETSRYNSTTQAIRAGYAPDARCAAHPELGVMGYHWIKHSLIDPVFDPLQPEVLLYAPGPGGNLRLVGVEYMVVALPGQALDGPDRPHFDGYAFDIGGVPPLTAEGVPHWSLHVWAHAENPSGVFAPYNPTLSCS